MKNLKLIYLGISTVVALFLCAIALSIIVPAPALARGHLHRKLASDFHVCDGHYDVECTHFRMNQKWVMYHFIAPDEPGMKLWDNVDVSPGDIKFTYGMANSQMYPILCSLYFDDMYLDDSFISVVALATANNNAVTPRYTKILHRHEFWFVLLQQEENGITYNKDAFYQMAITIKNHDHTTKDSYLLVYCQQFSAPFEKLNRRK